MDPELEQAEDPQTSPDPATGRSVAAPPSDPNGPADDLPPGEIDPGAAVQEPYGSTVLRTMHADGLALMEDYHQMMQVLDNPKVRSHVERLLAQVEMSLQKAEAIFAEQYGHLGPLADAMPADDKDMSAMASGAIPADSDPVGRPTPEEAARGMQKGGLKGKKKSLVPEAKSFEADESSLEDYPAKDHLCARCAAVGGGNMQIPRNQMAASLLFDGDDMTSRALEFLEEISEGEKSYWGDDDQKKAFAFHKIMDDAAEKIKKSLMPQEVAGAMNAADTRKRRAKSDDGMIDDGSDVTSAGVVPDGLDASLKLLGVKADYTLPHRRRPSSHINDPEPPGGSNPDYVIDTGDGLIIDFTGHDIDPAMDDYDVIEKALTGSWGVKNNALPWDGYGRAYYSGTNRDSIRYRNARGRVPEYQEDVDDPEDFQDHLDEIGEPKPNRSGIGEEHLVDTGDRPYREQNMLSQRERLPSTRTTRYYADDSLPPSKAMSWLSDPQGGALGKALAMPMVRTAAKFMHHLSARKDFGMRDRDLAKMMARGIKAALQVKDELTPEQIAEMTPVYELGETGSKASGMLRRVADFLRRAYTASPKDAIDALDRGTERVAGGAARAVAGAGRAIGRGVSKVAGAVRDAATLPSQRLGPSIPDPNSVSSQMVNRALAGKPAGQKPAAAAKPSGRQPGPEVTEVSHAGQPNPGVTARRGGAKPGVTVAGSTSVSPANRGGNYGEIGRRPTPQRPAGSPEYASNKTPYAGTTNYQAVTDQTHASTDDMARALGMKSLTNEIDRALAMLSAE